MFSVRKRVGSSRGVEEQREQGEKGKVLPPIPLIPSNQNFR